MSGWQFVAEPYDDETLSSWLVRTALLNHTHLYALFSHSDYKRGFVNYELDIFRFPSAFYLWLSKMSGFKVSRLKQMLMITYAGYVQEKVTSHPKQPWIITLGAAESHGSRFCPKCLQDDVYYRKQWRLMYVNICESHQCYLLNECEACGARIIPQRLDEHKALYQCYSCGYDLRQSHVENPKDNKYLLAQKMLQQVADDGYYIFGNRWQYSVGLFDLIHHIVLYLGRSGTAGKSTFIHKGHIEEAPPKVIAHLVWFATWLLNGWPTRFKLFCQYKKISNHFRLFDKIKWQKLPYWFIKEADIVFQRRII